MSEVRVELLSRIHFVRTFPSAALEYSRTPWVQVANLFGSVVRVSVKNAMPILISSRGRDLEVFVYDENDAQREWQRLEVTEIKELDPDAVFAQVRKATETA